MTVGYISEFRDRDPNAPCCSVCGALMVNTIRKGRWHCMSCGAVKKEQDVIRFPYTKETCLKPRVYSTDQDGQSVLMCSLCNSVVEKAEIANVQR